MSAQSSQPHPDQQYIEGLIRGDKRTFKLIYERYFPLIERYVRQNSGQRADAEDVFYKSLEIIYLQARDGLVITQSFKAYLKLICQRRWLNELRRSQRVVLNLKDQPEPYLDAEVIAQIEKHERKLLYRKHFQKLPIRCREILELTFEGKNYKEVAEQLKLNYSFVRRRGGECANTLMKNIHQDPLFNELK